MSQIWKGNISEFIELANIHEVKMLLVGGGAVNFHGYQRHSADVDFCIKSDEESFPNWLKHLLKWDLKL